MELRFQTQHFFLVLLFEAYVGHHTHSFQIRARWALPLLNSKYHVFSVSLNFSVSPKGPLLTPSEFNLIGLSGHILHLCILLISYIIPFSVSKYYS